MSWPFELSEDYWQRFAIAAALGNTELMCCCVMNSTTALRWVVQAQIVELGYLRLFHEGLSG